MSFDLFGALSPTVNDPPADNHLGDEDDVTDKKCDGEPHFLKPHDVRVIWFVFVLVSFHGIRELGRDGMDG